MATYTDATTNVARLTRCMWKGTQGGGKGGGNHESLSEAQSHQTQHLFKTMLT